MTAGPASAPAPRSLFPQEHGAWGQLAMPLLSGLLLAGPSPASLLLAAATVLAFVAHEPWLVAIGHRGERARTTDGHRAGQRSLSLAAAAAVAGAAGLWLAPPAVRLAALLPIALASVVLVTVLLDRERTIPGELAVSTALASAGALVALGSGATRLAAASLLATWAIAFGSTVFAVQTVLLRARSRGERDAGLRHALVTAGLVGGGSAVALAAGLGWIVPLAVLPTALLSLAVCLSSFSPARLKLLGWSLVAATTVTLLVLVVGLRRG